MSYLSRWNWEILENRGKGALNANPHGIEECWIIGIVGSKSGKTRNLFE
jgi:hypothetical protein